MRHLVLPQCDPARAVDGHGAQSVVRVREPKPGHDARKPDRRMQQQPALERHALRTAKESAAERIRGIVLNQRIEKPHDIRGTVLPVSIERHNVSGIVLQRELYSGLERSALPQINGVRDHGGADGKRNVPGAVMRTVIDDNHPIVSPYKVRDNWTDDGGLVERRYNDPNRARIKPFAMLRRHSTALANNARRSSHAADTDNGTERYWFPNDSIRARVGSKARIQAGFSNLRKQWPLAQRGA